MIEEFQQETNWETKDYKNISEMTKIGIWYHES